MDAGRRQAHDSFLTGAAYQNDWSKVLESLHQYPVVSNTPCPWLGYSHITLLCVVSLCRSSNQCYMSSINLSSNRWHEIHETCHYVTLYRNREIYILVYSLASSVSISIPIADFNSWIKHHLKISVIFNNFHIIQAI